MSHNFANCYGVAGVGGGGVGMGEGHAEMIFVMVMMSNSENYEMIEFRDVRLQIFIWFQTFLFALHIPHFQTLNGLKSTMFSGYSDYFLGRMKVNA